MLTYVEVREEHEVAVLIAQEAFKLESHGWTQAPIETFISWACFGPTGITHFISTEEISISRTNSSALGPQRVAM